MIKEIKYNGYTAQPSDYACADGDLAGAVNLVPDQGALSPVFRPRVLFTLDDTKKVRYMHKSASPPLKAPNEYAFPAVNYPVIATRYYPARLARF